MQKSSAKYAFEPPAITTLDVAGTAELFPVHRVFCVGRNYTEHAIEMGADDREPPFFFMKPAVAVINAQAAAKLPCPPMTSSFHHEVELVVAIGSGGSDIPLGKALEHVYGYAVGLDMTRRDLQAIAKQKSRPWEFAKSFAKSAPVSRIQRASDTGHPQAGAIWLRVNQALRQSSDLSRMIWSTAECIAELSRFDALMPGDLIMMGTPAGVAAVRTGDQLLAHIEQVGELELTVA